MSDEHKGIFENGNKIWGLLMKEMTDVKEGLVGVDRKVDDLDARVSTLEGSIRCREHAGIMRGLQQQIAGVQAETRVVVAIIGGLVTLATVFAADIRSWF